MVCGSPGYHGGGTGTATGAGKGTWGAFSAGTPRFKKGKSAHKRCIKRAYPRTADVFPGKKGIQIPLSPGLLQNDHIVEDHDVISVEAFIGNTAFEVITADGNSVSNLQAPDFHRL
jgi:hypothetical protein